jgi:hypothetical protein
VRHGENEVRLQALHRAPPSSWLRQLWSRKGDLQWAWNRDRKAVWDQVGLSYCRHEGLVTVRDEASFRRGHNDQSRQRHQCSETTLTGESWFHISTPSGIWTRVPCDRKQTGSPLDQWDMVRMKWDCRLSTPPPMKSGRSVSMSGGNRQITMSATATLRPNGSNWGGKGGCLGFLSVLWCTHTQTWLCICVEGVQGGGVSHTFPKFHCSYECVFTHVVTLLLG